MNRSGHLLYVAFLCQQSIEKILKGAWCHLRDDSPPYIHNLATLAELLEFNLSEPQQRLLDKLNGYYIVGRYPGFKQKLSDALDRGDATSLLEQTEKFIQWCKSSILT